MSTDRKAPPKLARHARGKRPQFYDTPGTDQAMSMILVLAKELSVLRDRVDSIERVAAEHGLDLAAGVEALQLDQAALAEREAQRQAFFGRLFYLFLKEAEETAGGQTAEGFNATIQDIAQG